MFNGQPIIDWTAIIHDRLNSKISVQIISIKEELDIKTFTDEFFSFCALLKY